jgi:hypothetical protein
MKNKNLLIGLGILAVAGIGYYMWKKKSETSSFDGEEYSNARAKGKTTTKTRAGTRRILCPSDSPSGYGWKICSDSVSQKDCCAGTGEGDVTTFTTAGGTRSNIFERQNVTRFT